MKKGFRRYAILLLTTVYLIAGIGLLMTGSTSAASLRRGDNNDQVKIVQRKLKNWGYYTGNVDGIFGSGTESAVRFFQRKNGLQVDGIVGPATAKALGMTITSTGGGGSTGTNNSGDVYLLARAIYGEARGEPYTGQVAVGAVILNRVKSSKFPNSISGVIYQPGAFSVVSDGQINLTPNDTALRAARDAMNGWDPTNGCLYYYNAAKTTNKWMLSKPVYLSIGQHKFFK